MEQDSINRAAEQPVLTAKGERADRILGRLCECSDNSVKMPYASMRKAAATGFSPILLQEHRPV